MLQVVPPGRLESFIPSFSCTLIIIIIIIIIIRDLYSAIMPLGGYRAFLHN